MKSLKIICSGLLFLAIAVLPAAAKKKHNGPCKADIEKFCGAKKGDREAMRACMKENKDKFSAECKESWAKNKEKHKAKHEERKAKMSKALEVCAPDIQKLCPEAKAAGAKKHAPIKCLMTNRDKISDSCKAALPERRVKKTK